ncbi:flagellar biosynthesis protein FlhF [Scleromatobacter humisilvae]|uniref:Flagellar biosynthesis protein FlhF n=1 Tax=Scleromatobacter humisilvae TaxID=2897159 RepID=A0A9X1YGW3_9BURK|nr:flagellar biosynthesis protein FlhF [Scleromatobacter humisilvae]MCK9684625.1 flagellar biosynthesis protein FlhF [Scleromatobacter humisilvae]
MNVKRFAARTSREALALVRQAFGVDAVVLSTKPCAEGIEVLAMAPDSVAGLERLTATPEDASPRRAAAPMSPAQRAAGPVAAQAAALAGAQRELANRMGVPKNEVEADADQLAMSTLSFQDYVRDRMLKRRHAELHNQPIDDTPAPRVESTRSALAQAGAARTAMSRAAERQQQLQSVDANDEYFDAPAPAPVPQRRAAPQQRVEPTLPPQRAARPAPQSFANVPELHDEYVEEPVQPPSASVTHLADVVTRNNHMDMVNELRSMKGLIEERFGALAFMEKLQRQPRQALLAQKLLDVGFSPALIRKMVDALPADAPDENAWAAGVLERNLLTNESELSMEDQGGVYALIGSTGVGKTTTTAKIAAGFAARHGAANLGLITLDAYRVGAHEQLRAYGRILGVPVHTAHDRASLEDLLELLAGKKMVLIDTAGMAQRDGRTRELLEMLAHRSIKKVLVVDASSQGETIDDVIINWKASACTGVILSKIDEAVKLAPALDALIRHKLKNIGVANGQRVPEDWHHLSANALVHRALKGGGSAAYRMDPQDVHLVFAHAGVSQQSAAALRV